MSGKYSVKFGVPEDHQTSSMMNATLSSLNDKLAISISVSPPSMDAPQAEIRKWLADAFRPLVAEGFDVEIQIGQADPS